MPSPRDRLATVASHIPAAPAVPAASCAGARPSQQVVVVTGCTSGLGLHLTREFARLGHTVAGCGRRKDIIASLNQELGGGGSSFHVVDVANEPAVEGFAKEVERRYGSVDVLVANAGLGAGGKLPWQIPVAHVHNIVDVSLKGLMFTNRHFVPLMLKGLDAAPLRRVVNVSSGVAHTAMPWAGDYCGVKMGVEGFSKCTAHAFNDNPKWRGRIICVPFAPGVVRTEMNTNPKAPPAEQWCKDAVPYLLQLSAADNGSSVAMPGYYSQKYQACWHTPANHKMNPTWAPPT